MEFVNLKLGNLHKSAETAAAAPEAEAAAAAQAEAGAAAGTTILWRSS